MDKNFNVLDFAKDVGIELWDAQRFMLKVLFKMPLTEDIVKIKEYPSGAIASYSERDFINHLYFNSMINMNLAMYEKECKNSIPFKTPIFILGRRSGKSLLSGLLLPYRAARLSYDGNNKISENDNIIELLISQSIKQAKDILTISDNILKSSSFLSDAYAVEEETGKRFRRPCFVGANVPFPYKLHIQAFSNNSMGIRGVIAHTVILEEAAHFLCENGAKSVGDIYCGTVPLLCIFDDALLMIITTPHKAEGFVYDKYTEIMKRDSHELVFRLPTWYVNLNIDTQFLREEEERSPEYFRREFGAEFIKEV